MAVAVAESAAARINRFGGGWVGLASVGCAVDFVRGEKREVGF
jgi:hypothetical protein